MIKKYCKKPEIIEAIQFDGTNKKEIERFTGQKCGIVFDDINNTVKGIWIEDIKGCLSLNFKAHVNDFIIRDEDDSLWSCQHDTFVKNYEEIA